jgi:hypothetical protein
MAYHLAYRDVVPMVKTWEWDPNYALRSLFYPAFLSIPLHILRFLGLDTGFMVVNSVFFMNTIIQTMGDIFMYKLAKNLLGTKGAKLALLYMLFNKRINEIPQKTLANGAELNLTVIAFYFFSKLKPTFDRNMACMTLFITISFIIRSSSLAGWIPLALYKILNSWDYFTAILLSGLLVALPTFALSIFIDSSFYGMLTFPPYNFVQVNVMENLSKAFGVDLPNYYLDEMREFITAITALFPLHLFVFALFTVYQINGRLPNTKDRFPAFFIFIVFNLLILSSVEHKE